MWSGFSWSTPFARYNQITNPVTKPKVHALDEPVFRWKTAARLSTTSAGQTTTIAPPGYETRRTMTELPRNTPPLLPRWMIVRSSTTVPLALPVLIGMLSIPDVHMVPFRTVRPLPGGPFRPCYELEN